MATTVRADTFLIQSTNGGRTWTDRDPGPPHRSLDWLRVDPETSTLYAMTRIGAGGHLLASTDGGQTWQTRHSIRVEPFNSRAATVPGMLYIAYENAGPISATGIIAPPTSITIVKISGSGETLEQYPAQGLILERPQFFTLMDLVVNPAKPASLYAVLTNPVDIGGPYLLQALWRSEDAGRNWSRVDAPVDPFCVDPEFRLDSSGATMYLLCWSDLLKSTDGGESWTRKAGPAGERIGKLEIARGAPGTLYVLRPDEIWKSADGAETWQRAGTLSGVWSLQVHPTNPTVLFAAASSGIHQSDNGGETWRVLLPAQFEYDPGRLGVHADPRTPDTLYLSSASRIELRLDGRQTFPRDLLGEKQFAPGSLMTVYGRDLARETRTADSSPLPLTLGGASVLFDGQPAPLLFASPDQINLQIPFGLSGAVTMEVRRADGSIDRQSINLSPRGVVILRENSTRQASPRLFHGSDFRPVTADDPARRGEAIILLASGMGELEPSISSGELPPTPPPQLRDPPCVVFSERPWGRPLTSALPSWAGAALGTIGLYQVNFEIPTHLDAGSYTLSLTYRPPQRVSPNRECSVEFQGAALDFVTFEIR